MATPTMEAPAYLATMTERQFQSLVIEAAELYGWIFVHFRQMVGNPSGWPDLILIRGQRTLFREIKTDRGEVSRRQQEWIDRLAAVGADVAVWRPSAWNEILAELRADYGFSAGTMPSMGVQ